MTVTAVRKDPVALLSALSADELSGLLSSIDLERINARMGYRYPAGAGFPCFATCSYIASGARSFAVGPGSFGASYATPSPNGTSRSTLVRPVPSSDT